jgi:putative tryptophan/tyrosine transport system substrate-binding protein
VRRRDFIALLGGAAVAPSSSLRVHAQQPAGLRRVGMLLNYEAGNPEARVWTTAFQENLATLGWTDGQNIKLEYRWVGSNDATRMLQAAKELVALQPDLIVSPSSPATAALLQETHTTPIVFVQVVDPVGQGFVKSMSRPGGNATGLVNLETSMTGKWVELLKQVMPALARVAVPYNPVASPYAELYLNYFKATAPTLGVEVISASVADLDALEAFLAVQEREPNTGCIPMPSGFISGQTAAIAPMLLRHHLPALYPIRAFAKDGGLLSYGNDITDNYRRAAMFVDRILKGEKPSDLPVQFPTKFELVINLKTAKALGLTVPLSLQAAADEVIE